MEIKYRLTEEDFIKFNLYHIENSPSQKRLLNLFRFILPLIFALPIYYIGTGVFEQPSAYWLTLAILFILSWIIYYPKKHKKTIIRHTKKLLSEGNNSAIFGEKTLSITKNKIKIFDENSSESILKKNINRVKFYEDIILIYISSISAHVIPTGDLKGEEVKYLKDYFDL